MPSALEVVDLEKIITSGSLTRLSLTRGIQMLIDAVRPVYGPVGRSVFVGRLYGDPLLIRSGAQLTEQIGSKAAAEDVGIRLMREMALSVVDETGDGSSTALIIAWSLISDALRNIEAGADPVAMRRGILKAVTTATSFLREISIDVRGRQDIENIATLSIGDSELGKLVADALESVNFRGTVSVKVSSTGVSSVEREPGMTYDRGYCSPYMSTDMTYMETVFESALIFLYDGKIERIDSILPLLNEVSLSGEKLLIIAEDVSSEVLTSMLSNIAQKTISLCVSKAPGFALSRRSFLEDIAVFTGAVVFGTEMHPDPTRATVSDCGRARQIKVTRNSTHILGGYGEPDALRHYICGLQAQLETAANARVHDELTERIAQLTDGTAKIRIGAATDTEQKYLIESTTSALKSAVCAAAHGILPGGGIAYIRAAGRVTSISATMSGDELTGANILASALYAPTLTMLANAGLPSSEITSTVAAEKRFFGFDIAQQRYCDMLESGIIDTTDACVCALEKAAHAAAQFITIEGMVLERPSPPPVESVPDNIHVSPSDLI